MKFLILAGSPVIAQQTAKELKLPGGQWIYAYNLKDMRDLADWKFILAEGWAENPAYHKTDLFQVMAAQRIEELRLDVIRRQLLQFGLNMTRKC